MSNSPENWQLSWKWCHGCYAVLPSPRWDWWIFWGESTQVWIFTSQSTDRRLVVICQMGTCRLVDRLPQGHGWIRSAWHLATPSIWSACGFVLSLFGKMNWTKLKITGIVTAFGLQEMQQFLVFQMYCTAYPNIWIVMNACTLCRGNKLMKWSITSNMIILMNQRIRIPYHKNTFIMWCGQCTTCISHKCSWGIRAFSKANWWCKSLTLNSMWEFETNNLVLLLKKDMLTFTVSWILHCTSAQMVLLTFRYEGLCKTLLTISHYYVFKEQHIFSRALILVKQMNKRCSSKITW